MLKRWRGTQNKPDQDQLCQSFLATLRKKQTGGDCNRLVGEIEFAFRKGNYKSTRVTWLHFRFIVLSRRFKYISFHFYSQNAPPLIWLWIFKRYLLTREPNTVSLYTTTTTNESGFKIPLFIRTMQLQEWNWNSTDILMRMACKNTTEAQALWRMVEFS